MMQKLTERENKEHAERVEKIKSLLSRLSTDGVKKLEEKNENGDFVHAFFHEIFSHVNKLQEISDMIFHEGECAE